MKNNSPFLQLHEATIGYQNPLIKQVDASLHLGEICLLMGDNGVGKTTLFKSILKQLPLLHGEIYLNGKKLSLLNGRQVAEETAVVFSKAAVPANYTVRDLVSFGKYIHYPYYFELNEVDKTEVARIIAQLKLEQYIDFPLNRLSDGNLQKAFIGRALAQDSPMIILDEPTTHLDEKNKIMILQLLRNLAKEQNRLILFSSHDWRLAKEFADKIWLLHEKEIHAGIAEEILLKHDKLLNAELFNLGRDFRPPVITAPELHKEMLYSFLQKNFPRDLSRFHFNYINNSWLITSGSSQTEHKTFEDISEFITKN